MSPPIGSGEPVRLDAIRQLMGYLASEASHTSSAELREWILVWLDAHCEDNPRDLTRDELIEAEGVRRLLAEALYKARQAKGGT